MDANRLSKVWATAQIRLSNSLSSSLAQGESHRFTPRTGWDGVVIIANQQPADIIFQPLGEILRADLSNKQ
jgi:hypothetical protein